jgi:hypothetical protein
MQLPKGFVQREEPKMVKFETGDCIEGRLSEVTRVTVKGKPCVKYLVDLGTVQTNSDGSINAYVNAMARVQFIGTHQINSRLALDDTGRFVIVRCVGEDVTVKRGDNCMKVFDIAVSPTVIRWGAVSAHGSSEVPEITDEDIPF